MLNSIKKIFTQKTDYKKLKKEKSERTVSVFFWIPTATKGLKVAEKLRLKKYDPVLKKHVWFVEKKMPPHSK